MEDIKENKEKVYVVLESDFESSNIIHIFSSCESAEACIKKLKEDFALGWYSYQEWEVEN